MKQMGMQQDEIDASNVIINKTDGSKIVINNPSVTKITMQGQESFQVTGDVSESEAEKFSEDDIKLVMEKTSCTKEEATEALKETEDIAEAILKLSS